MKNDDMFDDKLRRFQAEVSTVPSIVDDVMQRIEQKPIPMHRRPWTRSPLAAACAVAIVCLVGVTIAGWFAIAGRDSVDVAWNSDNQETIGRGGQSRGLVAEGENPPNEMQGLDPTTGPAPAAHDDMHGLRLGEERAGDTDDAVRGNQRTGTVPIEDLTTAEQAGESGRGELHYGEAADSGAGDVKIEYDRVATQPKTVVGTQGAREAPGPTMSPSGSQETDEQDGLTDPVGGYSSEIRLGDNWRGATTSKPERGRPSGKPADGLNDDTPGRAVEGGLSKSEAIRLAAKCIHDAEPNSGLKLDARSAIAHYCHRAKAYRGKSLWLVAFPESARTDPGNRDGENARATLYRMVWVHEDGSYSGNCQGELPPTNPPVLLGPHDEAKAIQIAENFLLRHHPELVGNRRPTATFNTDSRICGGSPIWIVGFTFQDDPPPPSVQAVWVTSDGAVILGGVVRMGPGPEPKKEARKNAAALWGPAVHMGPTIGLPKDEVKTSDRAGRD